MSALAGDVPSGIEDRPTPDGIEESRHDGLVKAFIVIFTAGPFLALGVAAWQAWNGLLTWIDLFAFALMYLVTILGVTVGYHRLFTHRSFRTRPAVRVALAVCGSMAVEG